MKKIIILGKSNASVSMILEILNNIYNGNLEISIIKNMEDVDNLAYNIKDIQICEINDIDHNNFDKSCYYFIGAFRTNAKKNIYDYFSSKYNINEPTYKFDNIISTNSFLASTVSIGNGCLISHMCVIDSYAKISNFVTINRCSSIGHHTFVDEFTTINPNTHIAGNCKIGKNVQIGMSVTIIDDISIGNNSIIGANSFVNKNIPDNVLVYGSPAKIIKYLN
jgi:sugar O-acyltransferase (sialic acid O-acetyltransferase NeuD family)